MPVAILVIKDMTSVPTCRTFSTLAIGLPLAAYLGWWHFLYRYKQQQRLGCMCSSDVFLLQKGLCRAHLRSKPSTHTTNKAASCTRLDRVPTSSKPKLHRLQHTTKIRIQFHREWKLIQRGNVRLFWWWRSWDRPVTVLNLLQLLATLLALSKVWS